MDSLEVNKACAAVLIAGIAFVGAGQIANVLVRPTRLHEAAIKIEGVEQAASAPSGPPTPAAPIGVLLASADVGTGESSAKKLCTSCHSFEEGGPNKVGPNLYGILGKPHGHLANFQYSTALKSKEGPWTYDQLNAWLHNPRGYAPGTKMAFAGIANDKQRADVILYLRSLSKDPEPLPEVPAATPAAAGSAAPAAAGQGAATGQGAANAPGNAAGTTPRPPQSAADAPAEGGTRAQPGQVVGPPGQGQAQGQQTSRPAPSMNQSQTETNQSQQPPNARQVTPGAPVQGGTEGGTRAQPGQVVGPPGQGQAQGQQTSRPAPSMNQSQTETNQSQQPPNARQTQ